MMNASRIAWIVAVPVDAGRVELGTEPHPVRRLPVGVVLRLVKSRVRPG